MLADPLGITQPGAIIEVNDKFGKDLIAQGAAEIVEIKADEAIVETADAAPDGQGKKAVLARAKKGAAE